MAAAKQQDTGKFRTNTKDQFYTRAEVARSCVKEILDRVEGARDRQWIEPAAGNGAFLKEVPEGIETLGIDLDPKSEGILKGDFLKWAPGATSKKLLLFGNPPFGPQSCLAKSFIKYGARLCDVIAFILPRSFEKPSMSRAFPMDFHLIFSMTLPKNAFVVNDSPYDVPCIFQIWIRQSNIRALPSAVQPQGFRYVKIAENWHIAFRRVGGLAGHCYPRDGTVYSWQSHYFLALEDGYQKHRDEIIEKVNAVEFPTNTVGPRSLSKQEVNEVLNEILASCF